MTIRRKRLKRADAPCLVRNRITGRWLVDAAGPMWSGERAEACLYPSRVAARTTVKSIGAVPFSIVPHTGDAA